MFCEGGSQEECAFQIKKESSWNATTVLFHPVSHHSHFPNWKKQALSKKVENTCSSKDYTEEDAA